MSQLEEMQNFVRIVEAGSISRAADQLGVAKSGVSRRLHDLEKRLGVRLMNRTTRRSSLTEAGQAYYNGSLNMISGFAELNAQVAGTQLSLEGTLRLAVPLSFGLCHLAPAIDEFTRAHPEVIVNIDFSDHHIDLVGQGVDLAIRIAELSDSSLQARRICPIRLMLCASPGYIEQHGVPETPQDLSQHKLLQYDVGGSPVFRLLDERGKEMSVRFSPRMIANNGDFLRDMALAGHGIILTPTFIVWQAIATGYLQPLLEDYWPPPLTAYAVYPQSRYLSKRARAFIDFLVERFGDTPYWDQFS